MRLRFKATKRGLLDPLFVVVDPSSGLDAIRSQLKNAFKLHFYTVDQINDIDPERNVVFGIDVPACPDIPEIKEWLATRPKGRNVIFVVDRGSWHAQAQAAALGAFNIFNRPLNGAILMSILLGALLRGRIFRICGLCSRLRHPARDGRAASEQPRVALFRHRGSAHVTVTSWLGREHPRRPV